MYGKVVRAKRKATQQPKLILPSLLVFFFTLLVVDPSAKASSFSSPASAALASALAASGSVDDVQKFRQVAISPPFATKFPDIREFRRAARELRESHPYFYALLQGLLRKRQYDSVSETFGNMEEEEDEEEEANPFEHFRFGRPLGRPLGRPAARDPDPFRRLRRNPEEEPPELDLNASNSGHGDQRFQYPSLLLPEKKQQQDLERMKELQKLHFQRMRRNF